jgi:hypothetical protein
MGGSTIFVVGFLRGELSVRTLSSCYGGWYEVPTTPGFSPVSHSSQAEVVPMVSYVG